MSKSSVIVLLLCGLAGFAFRDHALSMWLAISCLGTLLATALRIVRFPRKQMAVQQRGESEFQLLPGISRAERLRACIVPAIIAAVVGLILYIKPSASTGPIEREILVVVAMIAAITAVVFTILHLRRNAIEPRLVVSTDQPKLDEPFQFRIDTPASAAVAGRAHLRCYEHLLLHFGRYVHADVRPKSEQIVAFDPLGAEQHVTLDSATHLPTGRTRITSHPFYHWEIHVVIGDSNPTVTIFPLTVFKSAHAENEAGLAT